MGGKIVIDKSQKVVSAELDVNYKGWVAAWEKDLAKVLKVAVGVKKTLGLMGITSRPMKEADLKKIAAEKDAAKLIEEFKSASLEISGARFAWDDIAEDMDKLELKARSDLADQASAQMAARLKAIEDEIKRLNDEAKTLKERKSKLMEDIKLVTKAPRADYDKKVKELHATLLKTIEQNADLKKVGDAAKFIKKK